MTGTVLARTSNYALSMLAFGAHNWHTEHNRNIQVIDSLLFAATGLSGVLGEWVNTTSYVVGNRVTDPDSGEVFQCETSHISAATGTFSDDRTANAAYWSNITGTPINRGVWTNNVVYNANDFVVDNRRYAVCKTQHTSNASDEFDDDAVNWEILIDTSTIFDDPALSEVSTLTIPSTVESFEVSGHTTPGDGGACRLIRVGSQPSHELYRQSNDGAYWEIAVPENGFIPTRCGGEMGDNADYDTEINNVVAYAQQKGCHVLVVGPQAKATHIQLGTNTGFIDPPNFFGMGIAHNGNVHDATTTLTQNSGTTLPLIAFEGCRVAKYGKLALVSSVDLTGFSSNGSDITTDAYWNTFFGVDTQHAPDNVAIAIDPFLASGGAAHTLPESYAGAIYHTFQSSDVRGYDVLFFGWNICLAAQLGDLESNGDFVQMYGCQFIQSRYALSLGNGQARNTSTFNCTGNRIHTVFATDMHGNLNGRFAGVHDNMSLAGYIGRLLSIHGTATPAPILFSTLYVESLHRVLDMNGGGSGSMPVYFLNSFLGFRWGTHDVIPPNVVAGSSSSGMWRNSTAFVVGNRRRDRTTNLVYICQVDHTSAASGDFAADFAANPTYWELATNGGSFVPLIFVGCKFSGFGELLSFGCQNVIMKDSTLVFTNGINGEGTDWDVSTAYTDHQIIDDPDTGDTYLCVSAHTSAGSGTFADDRAGAASGNWLDLTSLVDTLNGFFFGYVESNSRNNHGQSDDMWNGAGAWTTRAAPATSTNSTLTITGQTGRKVTFTGHPAYATYGNGTLITERSNWSRMMVTGDGTALLLSNHDNTDALATFAASLSADFCIPA